MRYITNRSLKVAAVFLLFWSGYSVQALFPEPLDAEELARIEAFCAAGGTPADVTGMLMMGPVVTAEGVLVVRTSQVDARIGVALGLTLLVTDVVLGAVIGITDADAAACMDSLVTLAENPPISAGEIVAGGFLSGQELMYFGCALQDIARSKRNVVVEDRQRNISQLAPASQFLILDDLIPPFQQQPTNDLIILRGNDGSDSFERRLNKLIIRVNDNNNNGGG